TTPAMTTRLWMTSERSFQCSRVILGKRSLTAPHHRTNCENKTLLHSVAVTEMSIRHVGRPDLTDDSSSAGAPPATHRADNPNSHRVSAPIQFRRREGA